MTEPIQDPRQQRLIELADRINQKLDRDRVLRPDDVSVNPGLDGQLKICWAERPNRRQRHRFRAILKQAREEMNIPAETDDTEPSLIPRHIFSTDAQS